MTERISYFEGVQWTASTYNRNWNSLFDFKTQPFSHFRLLTLTKFSCNTTHFWCRITLVRRIQGIATITGLLHLWGIRSELLRVRTKDRSYSNSSSELLVDCDGHCSRSTASACGAVCHIRRHNLEGLATIVSRGIRIIYVAHILTWQKSTDPVARM